MVISSGRNRYLWWLSRFNSSIHGKIQQIYIQSGARTSITTKYWMEFCQCTIWIDIGIHFMIFHPVLLVNGELPHVNQKSKKWFETLLQQLDTTIIWCIGNGIEKKIQVLHKYVLPMFDLVCVIMWSWLGDTWAMITVASQ